MSLKYARNENRKHQTPTAQTLALLEIVIDKMHMSGHVHQWCRANCDPKHFDALQNVSFYNLSIITHCTNVKTFRSTDTEVCEQCLSWLSCYGKMTRRMKRSTFMFFLLYVCDLHNEREESKLKRGHYME